MPHFGLMDEDVLGPEAAALMRAKLHIRGGKRRLRQGKISIGIITLYDAVVMALQWYVTSPERREKLLIEDGEDLKDDQAVFGILKRSGIFDSDLDYGTFNALVEKALKHEMPGFDCAETLVFIESVMTQLGIMPFDENELPPEDPSTV